MTTRTVAMLLLAGCLRTNSSTNAGSSSPGSNPWSEPDLPQGGDLACTQGVSDSIVDAQVSVMQETADSYHEMVACGGIAYDLSASLYRILVTSMLESNGVSVPGGFVYDGEGHYVTGSGGTTMFASYLYGDDLEVGAEDELVTFDLFDLDNYLSGLSVALDPIHQELLVSYTQAGPLIELLGQGSDPPNPLSLSIADIEEPYLLGRLKLVIEAPTNDVRPGATVTYTLGAGPNRINPLLNETSSLVFALTESSTLAGNGATLTSTAMGIDYDDSPGELTGDIPFEVRGGGLDLDGVMSFQHSTMATLDWWCPE